MRRTSALTLSFIGLAVALTSGLAGCSIDPLSVVIGQHDAPASVEPRPPKVSVASPVLDAAPATGDVVTGDGYTYVIPDGWGAYSSADAAALGLDTVGMDLTPTGGFASNVNVVPNPAGSFTADQVEAIGVGELEKSGASDVAILDRLTVAGSESAHLSGSMESGGISYRIDQYYATKEDQTYIITFSFLPSMPDDDAKTIAESVLVTFAWL